MVYITADGKIHQGERPRARLLHAVQNKLQSLQPRWKCLATVALALVARHVSNTNPFANGKIPAADVMPGDHWNHIESDDSFMRRLTEHLGRNRNLKLEQELKLKSGKMEIVLDRVDFGGVDGHRAEGGDWSDMETMRGTRCSTTRSAVTAYFCGVDVAMNQDVVLEEKRKPSNLGVTPFFEYITCRHRQAETSNGGIHRRAVYRIGVGCEDSLAGYSHAFNIVAQPDGTFLWLQSYISQYSIQTWMGKRDWDDTPSGHLTLDQLLGKLKQLERLMDIWSWTPQANADYYDLFGVDKDLEAIKHGKPPVLATWEASHRLSVFLWDEACEYPLPVALMDGFDSAGQETVETQELPPPQFDTCDLSLAGNLLAEFAKYRPELA